MVNSCLQTMRRISADVDTHHHTLLLLPCVLCVLLLLLLLPAAAAAAAASVCAVRAAKPQGGW
jgi:hypothetical protein